MRNLFGATDLGSRIHAIVGFEPLKCKYQHVLCSQMWMKVAYVTQDLEILMSLSLTPMVKWLSRLDLSVLGVSCSIQDRVVNITVQQFYCKAYIFLIEKGGFLFGSRISLLIHSFSAKPNWNSPRIHSFSLNP